jgi:predicted GIY-YIG superfamily endonuclease
MSDAVRTALYRFFDADGQLLYVGIAKDVRKRWQQHEEDKSWWHLVTSNRVEWLPTREEARQAELQAMRTESPLFNHIRHPDGSYTHNKYDDTAEVDHAAEELLTDLSNGTLRPGDRINPVQLGRRYGVAASSVGMALNFLPPRTIACSGQSKFVADPDCSDDGIIFLQPVRTRLRSGS